MLYFSYGTNYVTRSFTKLPDPLKNLKPPHSTKTWPIVKKSQCAEFPCTKNAGAISVHIRVSSLGAVGTHQKLTAGNELLDSLSKGMEINKANV